MSNKMPESISDLNKFAGKFVTAESPFFDLLPEGSTIVVGGNGRRKPTSYESQCFLCGTTVFMDSRDNPCLAGLTLCILCPECYFKMEPKDPDAS